MNPEIRASFQTNQFYYFLIILSLTTVSQLATMLTIVFGNISGKENLITASVIAMGFMGAFGIIRIMTNMKMLIDEMDDGLANTNWGKETKAIPIHILRFIFAGIILIVAIIQLITIYG